jgi:hypothetical protein
MQFEEVPLSWALLLLFSFYFLKHNKNAAVAGCVVALYN